MNSLSSEFSTDPLWFPQIHHELTFSFANPLYSREFKNSQPREFYTHLLSFQRIPNRYSIIFPYLLWIHYQLHALTINQLYFEIWELIHLFRELTMNSLLFSRFTMDLLSFPRIHYEFTFSYINSTWTVNSVSFLRFTMDPLSFSRIHYENYQLRKFTMNLLSFSRFNFSFCDQYGSIYFLLNSESIQMNS